MSPSGVSIEVGSAMPDLVLLGFDGANDVETSLAAFWRERPTLVVFLRHFG